MPLTVAHCSSGNWSKPIGGLLFDSMEGGEGPNGMVAAEYRDQGMVGRYRGHA
jgi:hypothetical protein